MSQNPPHLPRHPPSSLSFQMICAYLAERSCYTPLNRGQTFYCDSGVEYFARAENSTNVYTQRLRPEVQPHPLPFYIPFFTKKGKALGTRLPFRIPSTGKWYPFYITCLELCIPVHAPSFKQESITKIERFLDFLACENIRFSSLFDFLKP